VGQTGLTKSPVNRRTRKFSVELIEVDAAAASCGHRAIAGRVVASTIWKEAQKSGKRHTEVSVSGCVETKTLSQPPESMAPKAVVEGVIDLVYLTLEGWKIIDYKTDTVTDEADLKRLAEWHAPQLRAYAKHWETIVGERVVYTCLYFVRPDLCVSI